MKRTNKKSLYISATAILLSIALLAGTTLAWFTDSVSNTGNKIEAGTLQVQLLKVETVNGTKVETDISDSETLFSPMTFGNPVTPLAFCWRLKTTVPLP